MSTDTFQPRQPKGIPVGGQFSTKTHGESEVSLAKGDGGGTRRPRGYWTQDTFLAHAREIHGDRYDYSEVTFTAMTTAVIIVCRVHGPFSQPPVTHIHRRSGCWECNKALGRPRLGRERFVERARVVHGDRYDYSLVVYEKNNVPVTIVCSEHGAFPQQPDSHLAGRGCSACGRARTRASRMGTAERFLERALEVHGDRYDYSLVDYAGLHRPVVIVCGEHGSFSQTPANHAHGQQGCPDCAAEAHGEWSRLSHEAFMERALAAVGDRYDLSLVDYRGMHEKITVTCRTHGDFQKRPGHLLRGSGCPRCAESTGERAVASVLSEHGVVFESEFTHSTLRDKGPLRFDFAIPSQRVLIEFDGEQHRRPVTFGMSEDRALAAFARTQRRDRIKDEWARENGWRLLRLSEVDLIAEELSAAGVIDPTVGS